MKLFLISILFLPLAAFSQLQMAGIFSDHMVLQRDQPVHFWGTGVPGEKVLISFSNDQKEIIVKTDSSWSIYFKKQKANTIPQSVRVVSGNERIEYKNILIGDVWLCIGQSNMEWPMERELHFKTELPASNQPLLRIYNPTYAGKNIFATAFSDSVIQRLNFKDFYNGNWQPCDSQSFRTMSAVAYYFGKNIAKEINVPVGLINLSIGGAPLETFIDPAALQQHKQFAAKLKGDWLLNDALPDWTKERGQQNVGSVENVPSDKNGKNHAYKPGFAYKSGIEHLLPFPIKGLLNYQGESNAQEKERVEEYAALNALLVNDYRQKWQKNLPYYFVQISSIDTAYYKGHLWPQFRDQQRKMLSIIANSGMAVSSDVGAANDVHPANKKVVGERLARWALHQTYHKPIIPSGPLPVKALYKNGQVTISFLYADGLQTRNSDLLKGFSIDGKESAEAKIQHKKVIVNLKQKPGYIYYGWQPFSKGNLQNGEQLPASTFKLIVNE